MNVIKFGIDDTLQQNQELIKSLSNQDKQAILYIIKEYCLKNDNEFEQFDNSNCRKGYFDSDISYFMTINNIDILNQLYRNCMYNWILIKYINDNSIIYEFNGYLNDIEYKCKLSWENDCIEPIFI